LRIASLGLLFAGIWRLRILSLGLVSAGVLRFRILILDRSPTPVLHLRMLPARILFFRTLSSRLLSLRMLSLRSLPLRMLSLWMPLGPPPLRMLSLRMLSLWMPLGSLALRVLPLGSLSLRMLPLGSLALRMLPLGSLALRMLPLGSLALRMLALRTLALWMLALRMLPLRSFSSGLLSLRSRWLFLRMRTLLLRTLLRWRRTVSRRASSVPSPFGAPPRLVTKVAEELQPFVLQPLVDRRLLLRRPILADGAAAKPERVATFSLVAVGIADQLQHGSGVRCPFGNAEVTTQPRVGCQQVLFVEAPHLFRQRNPPSRRDVAREEAVEVVDVADQELARIRIVSAVDRLWKVDDHGPVRPDEHVELRQIAVHDARAEHLHGRANQAVVHPARGRRIELEITQARGRVAVGVDDELHE